MKNYRYTIKGLDCANCARKIEENLNKMDEYEDVIVNFSTSKISLKSNLESDIKNKLEKQIQSIEEDVILLEEHEEIKNVERTGIDVLRLIIGVLIFIVGKIIQQEPVFTIISLIILLAKTAKKAIKQLLNKVLDESFLITVSCIGAFFVGEGMEGVMVITLYEIGKILESKAIGKTRKSISDLMDIKPEYANLKTGEKVNPEEVKVGDTIIIKAGEKIPLDGIVIDGETEIDNSALTGESKLVKISKGSSVISGGININGVIEVKVQKTYENSTVNQILNLVENATDKKAKTETFVTKAAKIYTPIVVFLAILVAIIIPLITKTTYNESIYKALTFLVISCPCAIAISVPLSYFTGIGRASKKGILIKGSDYLDTLKDINEIIFDKTGTITTGKFEVEDIIIINEKYNYNQILEYLGAGEQFSKHPIAESIMRKVKKQIKGKLKIENVSEYEEVSGKGIKFKYDGKQIKIGNAKFVEFEENEEKNGTILFLNIDNDVVAKIVLNDEVKKGTKEALEILHKKHITTKMFTGDKKEVAKNIASKIGIQEVKAEMLPTDKFKELEKELGNNKKVAFVGDGINDSPVLARADVGISMGGIGSSSAIEASDVVIMTDELSKISDAINISKKTNKIIKQNLIFAIGVKIAILFLSFLGIADMWEAVFADVGVTLITIFNTIRI